MPKDILSCPNCASKHIDFSISSSGKRGDFSLWRASCPKCNYLLDGIGEGSKVSAISDWNKEVSTLIIVKHLYEEDICFDNGINFYTFIEQFGFSKIQLKRYLNKLNKDYFIDKCVFKATFDFDTMPKGRKYDVFSLSEEFKETSYKRTLREISNRLK